MLHRLCHPFRFLSFSLLWCTTLCHIFALASPLIRRGGSEFEFRLRMFWGKASEGYYLVKKGYKGEDCVGLLFVGISTFELQAHQDPTDGPLLIAKADPLRNEPEKGRTTGRLDFNYYRDLHVTVDFQSGASFQHHIAIIMDPPQLVKELNTLIVADPEHAAKSWRELTETSEHGDGEPASPTVVPTFKNPDAFSWVRTTLMYLKMITALDGSAVDLKKHLAPITQDSGRAPKRVKH
ncbi:hypothetical protein C8R42DRAFT_305788 [Lentinula raphanica]|nr:hypothetical protein C8R42DRAFT_305788 [Lentinula raphanica]